MPRLAVLVIVFALLAAGQAQAAAPGLFGCPERPADADEGYTRGYGRYWQRVMDSERERPSFGAQGGRLAPADARQWRNLAAYAGQTSFPDTLRAVNGYFNQWQPKTDQASFGADEYWASPAEFIARRGGDCEDYAIAKYYALRQLNVPAGRLRVVIVRQRDAKGVPEPRLHAVLAALSGDTWFILDNNARPRDGITPHTQYGGRFVPLYSMNESGAWSHCADPLQR
jgi:predicted transglutaminase-like cysteine proteinase